MDLDALRKVHDSRGPKPEIAKYRPISADSHVCEPPNMYRDYIDPAFRDRAPRVVKGVVGDVFVVEGVPTKVPLALVAAAGLDPRDILVKYSQAEDLHPGGWDPKARLAAQDEDGVVAEIIYPTVGMVTYNMPEPRLQHATMWAYNRWLKDFCSHDRTRLFGIGQTPVYSVQGTIADIKKLKEMGFKGVQLVGYPWGDKDYDDRCWDPLWAACVDLEMPICFHVFGSGGRRGTGTDTGFPDTRGPAINGWHKILRDNQDILGMFIFSGIFDRFPALKLVCVEADAGWAPHFMYRMDHMYLRHRFWQKAPPLSRVPSDYFRENIWLTFQDDLVAFKMLELINPSRLMWANDFPHTDSTWPWSHGLLREQMKDLSEKHKHQILHQNVKDLFQLETD